MTACDVGNFDDRFRSSTIRCHHDGVQTSECWTVCVASRSHFRTEILYLQFDPLEPKVSCLCWKYILTGFRLGCHDSLHQSSTLLMPLPVREGCDRESESERTRAWLSFQTQLKLHALLR